MVNQPGLLDMPPREVVHLMSLMLRRDISTGSFRHDPKLHFFSLKDKFLELSKTSFCCTFSYGF